MAELQTGPRVRLPASGAETRALRSIEYSFSSSCLACVISQHGHKQVGDAGCAHIAERGELLTIDAIKQQNAATKHRTFMNRLERPCRSNMLGIHNDFYIARLQ